ncbi:MAG: hypothetical protein ACHQYP_05990 [Nitrospiria bacterium]
MEKKIQTIYLNIYPPNSIFKTRGFYESWEAEEEAALRSSNPQWAPLKVAAPYNFEAEDRDE